MNYIAIPHTLPARRWEVKSLEDAAIDDGLEIEKFNSREDVVDSVGGREEYIPESYWENIKKVGFPCVHVYDNGSFNCWEKEETFDPEQTALEYFEMNFNSIIKVETIEDAKFCAEKYTGHQCPKVRSIAADILEEMEAEDE